MDTDGLSVVASSTCPICGQDTPHTHTVIERAFYWQIEPIAKALCAAAGKNWEMLGDEWPWSSGRFLCRDFFRWQARHALGITRPVDWYDEPTRAGIPTHGGNWPLSAFRTARFANPNEVQNHQSDTNNG